MAKGRRLVLRTTDEEMEWIDGEAKRAGLSVSDWVRGRIGALGAGSVAPVERKAKPEKEKTVVHKEPTRPVERPRPEVDVAAAFEGVVPVVKAGSRLEALRASREAQYKARGGE